MVFRVKPIYHAYPKKDFPSPYIATNSFNYHLLEDGLSTQNLKILEQDLNDIVLLEPDFYPARKGKLMIELMGFSESTPLEQIENWYSEVNDLYNFDIQDPQRLEMTLASYILLKTDKAELGNFLQNASVFDEDLYIYHYFLAYYLWSTQDREGAIRELQKALEFEPNDKRIMKTLDSIKEAKIGSSGLFEIDLDFKMSTPPEQAL